MSQAQGPCWVRRRLEARALVILTHTHSEQQVKLFCFAGRVCPAGYKSQELNNFFHFLFKNILFFIGLSYVCLCFCLWLCASKVGALGIRKRGLEFLELELPVETTRYERWELNSGSLLLPTAEPSLQLHKIPLC